MKPHFTIAIDTMNHEGWIEKCLSTSLTQKYDNYEVILVDAISNDNTWEICKKFAKDFDRLTVYQNETRLTQAGNFKFLNDMTKPGSIVVSIDGDDWFKHNKVLQKLESVYSSEEVWMTYGTYEEYPFRDVSSIYQPYPEEVVKNNSFREHRWMASHLRTWRKELFDKIKDEDFKNEQGEWIKTACDQVIMFPMLEMASERSRHISDVTYVYNVANFNREGTILEDKQIESSNFTRSRKKYSRIENL